MENLMEILAAHSAWLKNEGGERANLRKADLREANLRKANLSEANLYEADGCMSAQSPTSGRITFYHPESDYVQSGCRKTTLAGFKAAVAETYPDVESKDRRGYEAIIVLFEVYAVAKTESAETVTNSD